MENPDEPVNRSCTLVDAPRNTIIPPLSPAPLLSLVLSVARDFVEKQLGRILKGYLWPSDSLDSKEEEVSQSNTDTGKFFTSPEESVIFDEPLSYVDEEEMNAVSSINSLRLDDTFELQSPYVDQDLGCATASPMSMEFTQPFDYQEMLSEEDIHYRHQSQHQHKRRKALLIGIKYYRRKDKRIKGLKGPHHDVQEIKKLLQDVYGWTPDCFRILKDDNTRPENQPTLENIKFQINELVKDALPGDHLFFYYSGHGGQVPDTNGDEDDGMDEVIVSRCHLTALMDCCSSGTGLDLPFDPVRKRAAKVRKLSEGDVVLLSACEDGDRAFEKKDEEDEYKRVRGMLTLAFINSLKRRRMATYDDLMNDVRLHLQRRKTIQTPQLSSSHMIKMDDYILL
ncbi:peptidase [Pyrrhoderma noxium]|uniref:Peptidase n=1 Tax=Pyrrhoderma noxium TaxID=2282107 RepID=A0A286UXD9_9AGAM|nr:peptidase [Pyrrhoderma noxium]